MTITRTLTRLATLCLALAAHQGVAQTVEQLRGGWSADLDGVRHVFYLVLRNDTVSGVYCTDCSNPDTLAFIDDGNLDESGLHFRLYHSPRGSEPGAEPVVETVDAALQGAELSLVRTRPGAASLTLLLHRTPPAPPAPVADFANNRPVNQAVRSLPGAAEPITPEKVVGLWLWGSGPAKQYFIFKRHKDRIRGMVCGPCETAADMAPLENIRFEGTNLHFDIVHEDNGANIAVVGPHSNVTEARISRNEMQISAVPSYQPDARPIEMTLLGPVVFQLAE